MIVMDSVWVEVDDEEVVRVRVCFVELFFLRRRWTTSVALFSLVLCCVYESCFFFFRRGWDTRFRLVALGRCCVEGTGV